MITAPAPAAAAAATAGTRDRIARVVVQGDATASVPSVYQEADRAQAIADLEAENLFALLPTVSDLGNAARGSAAAPAESVAGPYVLRLALQEGRLLFDVRRLDETPLHLIALALGPFRRLIKDYQILIDAYETALAEGREARIQAVDMGRRGLHDEGAGLLQERLHGKAEMDFATARRLFTLVCALHQRI